MPRKSWRDGTGPVDVTDADRLTRVRGGCVDDGDAVSSNEDVRMRALPYGLMYAGDAEPELVAGASEMGLIGGAWCLSEVDDVLEEGELLRA